MFKNVPAIFAHKSITDSGSYIGPDNIISKDNILLNRYCPHRMYPLGDVGTFIKENIVCKFHGFEWSTSGIPINNNRNINCGKTITGTSGLLFRNFVEPESKWVNDLANEDNIEFSHICTGSSKGSWLWMMDIQTDLLHIRKGNNVIHPTLASVTNLDEIKMFEGVDWVLQTSDMGWWLFIYPFTFVEWTKGCIAINTVTPDDINNEFGFTWTTQFYYDPSIPIKNRNDFETLEDVFHEDVGAIEQQKGSYFPIISPCNRLENHCAHFGKWVKENKIKDYP